MLIDESERSFRKGMIVTATVSKVFDTKAVCRLENGLAAIILEQDIVEAQDEKISSKLDFGHIITGRIKSIDCEHDKPFEVKL
jgi:ribosomal protein S1